MAVMRSLMYIPGNNPKMIAKAPTIPADIITLDMEDAVPPAQKEAARKITRESLEIAGQGGAEVYVRINNWDTGLAEEDMEAVVWPGLNGIVMGKTASADDVKRMAWKLDDLEKARGIAPGTVKISCLIETAKGIVNAKEICLASERNVSAIFGAVDYCLSMRIKLTSEAKEQYFARSYVAICARMAGLAALDAPFAAFRDMEAFKKNTLEGIQMGYEGRMIIHPSQVEVANQLYAPDPEEVEWSRRVVKVFEEEGIAKGTASVNLDGNMVDTPVYLRAVDVLRAQAELDARYGKK
jgi:citrate lyase subunit beta/citryl-CoA lyase